MSQDKKFSQRSRMRGSRGGGPGMIHGVGEKAKDFKGTTKKFIIQLRPFYLRFALVFVFTVISCVFSVIGPRLTGSAVTIIAENGIDFASLNIITVRLLVLYIISGAASFVQNFVLAEVSAKISYDFRDKLRNKIDRMPLSYFDKTSYGDVLSRVTNDVDTVNQTMNQSLGQIINGIVTVAGVIIMMFVISPLMTIIAFITMLLAPLAVSFIVKLSQRYFREQQRYLGMVNGQIEESFSGQSIIKIFSAEDRTIKSFDDINEKLYQTGWKSQFISTSMHPVMNTIGNLSYVAVCVAGSFMTIGGVIKVGSIVSFIQYMRNINQPIAQLAQVSNILQSTAAAAERIFQFLDEDEEENENHKKSLEVVDGKVVFENVKFSYEKGKEIIHNFSASIEQGRRVAIVGPTGAGKTTIVKLLMRFYQLDSGKILIDGTDISEVTRNSLRQSIGMVLQDAWLFNGTIMENIRFGKEGASDEEVYQAARDANVHHFIQALPGGYNFEIGEDSDNVSLGQKQLLTIARAFLSDPKILVLDEATSSVDTRTELIIQQAMSRLMKNRTSFVIAHRLSTIKDADIILVIKDGDITEQGCHDDLLAKAGFYAELYNSQFDEC